MTLGGPGAVQAVPPDESNCGDRRAARRAAARRYHPDLGGSAHQLLAAFAEIDARFSSHARPDGPLVTVAHPTAKRLRVRLRRWCRRRRASHYFSL